MPAFLHQLKILLGVGAFALLMTYPQAILSLIELEALAKLNYQKIFWQIISIIPVGIGAILVVAWSLS